MGNFAYTNALSYLNGAGTGIETFAPIGQPSSDPQVTIRSKGLLPQYMNIILDGLPFYGTMADIQVQDIESIEVLKDAVSTSMLGHYPLQGIIRIQTKRQATNTFALTINIGISQKGEVEPDVLEPKAYYKYAWKVIRDLTVNWGIPLEHANLLASGLWPRDSDGIQKYNGINYGDVHSYLRNPKIFNIPNSELMDSEGKLNPSAQILNPENLNWWKEVARTGQRHEVHGSFHKRFRTLYFYTSASLLKEEGWAYNSFLERATGRLSLTYSPLS